MKNLKEIDVKSLFSVLLIFTFLSVSFGIWLMAVYFAHYNAPIVSGLEWYPAIVIAYFGIIWSFVVLFFFSIFLVLKLDFSYAIIFLIILILPVIFSSIFPEYKYSPQRIALRMIGMGGKTVSYRLHRYRNFRLLRESKKNMHKAYLIYTGEYFYYFATKNGTIGINKEICHVSWYVNIS